MTRPLYLMSLLTLACAVLLTSGCGSAFTAEAGHLRFVHAHTNPDAGVLRIDEDSPLERLMTLADDPEPKKKKTKRPPVLADGTGVLCSDDSECTGPAAKHCLVPKDKPKGFCTIEGCKKGACGDGYTCCGKCHWMAESSLPFSGSACVPEGPGAKRLEDKAKCTCG